MPTPPEFDIAGKVFVVTGAGRGIGKGIAEVLAEAGARGAITALTPTHVLPLAGEISRQSGQQVIGIVADGTRGNAMTAVVDQVVRQFGRIDIWVNCIGDSIRTPLVALPGADGDDTDLSDAELHRVLDINLTSIIVGCRAIGGYFARQGGGRVINIGSFFAVRGGANLSVYTAGKAGIEGLTRALALEWAAHGITVNCINAGQFPDAAQLTAEQLEQRRERARALPLGRVGELREAGLLTLYLASAAGSYMTGQSLALDGGVTL